MSLEKIDRANLKSFIREIMVEEKDFFKELIDEVLEEKKISLDKNLGKILTEDREVLKKLAQ